MNTKTRERLLYCTQAHSPPVAYSEKGKKGAVACARQGGGGSFLTRVKGVPLTNPVIYYYIVIYIAIAFTDANFSKVSL